MSWTNQQKRLVHRYARAAAIPDQIYRAILHDVSGCRSAAHPGLTQYAFEHVMARLEGRLDAAVQEGVVQRPAWVRDLWHWRHRLPPTGALNSRHSHLIRDLWDLLIPHLSPEQCTQAYLAGIASKSCGTRIDSVWECTAWQAGLVIDALRDRLRYATRSQPSAVSVDS